MIWWGSRRGTSTSDSIGNLSHGAFSPCMWVWYHHSILGHRCVCSISALGYSFYKIYCLTFLVLNSSFKRLGSVCLLCLSRLTIEIWSQWTTDISAQKRTGYRLSAFFVTTSRNHILIAIMILIMSHDELMFKKVRKPKRILGSLNITLVPIKVISMIYFY